jgi:hypothetical protein
MNFFLHHSLWLEWSHVNVNLLLSTSWRHTGGVNIHPHSLLTSKADRSKWLTLPPKRDPQYHIKWRVGWLQSQIGDLEGEKNRLPLPGPKPWTVQPIYESLYWLHFPDSRWHLAVLILCAFTYYMSIIRDAVSVSGTWYRKCIASLVLLMLLSNICCNIILQWWLSHLFDACTNFKPHMIKAYGEAELLATVISSLWDL